MTTTTTRAARPAPPRTTTAPRGITRIVEITPELAARWIEMNTTNRAVSDNHVEQLARDVAAGAWQFTGEAIKWQGDPDDPTSNPKLLDGQHRLYAVLLAEKPITSLVVTGLDREAQDVMDTGKRRSAMNMLELEGVEDAGLVAATANMVMLWEQGAYAQADYRGPKTPTHSEIRDWVGKHMDRLREAVEITKKYGIKGLTRASRAVAAYMLLDVADREKVEEFFQSISELKGLKGAGDPRTALINRLRYAESNRQQIPRWVQANMIFRAWNALQRKEPIMRMQITSAQSNPNGRGNKAGKSQWINPEAPLPYLLSDEDALGEGYALGEEGYDGDTV